MGSTISSIPIIGQSPIGLIIGAISGNNNSSSSTTPNVSIGIPLVNPQPAIFVPGPKTVRGSTYTTTHTTNTTTTTPASSSSDILEDIDTTNILYIAGGIIVLVLLLR